MVEEIATELIISAAQLGLGDVIATLVARGADVEERDLRRGGRPLMHAANKCAPQPNRSPFVSCMWRRKATQLNKC